MDLLTLFFYSKINLARSPKIFFLLANVFHSMEDLYPNQQRTLNKLPTELECRSFVNKLSIINRLSIQVGANPMVWRHPLVGIAKFLYEKRQPSPN